MRALTLPNFSLASQLRGRVSRAAKRLLDIVGSSMALLLLAPFFGLIAWAIKRDSPGPVFYGGPRIGRGGKVFKIWKFRTMYEDARSYQGPRVTAQDDPRITPIGHWLRDTKLNELPQFWNVLKGEMSLVGPRPEDPSFAKTWAKPVWDELTSVRPGITSPASVQYRNEEKLLSEGNATQKYVQELGPDKIRLDQLYVRHHGFWLDMDTLFWTFLLLLPRIKRYTPPESLLFVGPATRLARRYLNWFTIDALTMLIALGITGLIWRVNGPLNFGWTRSIAFGLAFALLYSLLGALLGVNRIHWTDANFTDALDLVPGWLIATLTVTIINTTYQQKLPNRLIFTAALLALAGFIFNRYRSRLLMVIFAWVSRALPGVRTAGERVLIIGADRAAQHAAWLLGHQDNANKFYVVGFVDNDIFKQGTRIYGANLLGTCKELSELISKHDIGLVVVTNHQRVSSDFRAITSACRTAGVRVVVLPNLLGVFNRLGDQRLAIPVTASGCQTGDCGDPSLDEDDDPCLNCLTRYTERQVTLGEHGGKQ